MRECPLIQKLNWGIEVLRVSPSFYFGYDTLWVLISVSLMRNVEYNCFLWGTFCFSNDDERT